MDAAGCDVTLQECVTFVRGTSGGTASAAQRSLALDKATLTSELDLPELLPEATTTTRLRPLTALPVAAKQSGSLVSSCVHV